jgi:hypothetical protein
VGVPSFLVETFLARGSAGAHRALEQATRSAVEALSRDGTPVRFAGSFFVPEDEICLYTFDAPSLGDVERIVECAGLRLLRVVEAIPSDKEIERTCAVEPSSSV